LPECREEKKTNLFGENAKRELGMGNPSERMRRDGGHGKPFRENAKRELNIDEIRKSAFFSSPAQW